VIELQKPLPEPGTCILYAEFLGHVEIDNTRNAKAERVPFKVLTKPVKYVGGLISFASTVILFKLNVSG
jgi:hypothetical protein